MEITQRVKPELADYYHQLMGIPGHIVYVDTGYFAARAHIKHVNPKSGKVTYRLDDADAELLRKKIEESMR